MTDGSAAAHDPLQAWLEATRSGPATSAVEATSSRRPAPIRLLAITAVVCAAALGLGAAVVSSSGGRDGPRVPVAPAMLVAPSPAPTNAPATETMRAAPTAPAHPVPDPLAAAAVLAVRAGAGTDTYVDTAVVEDSAEHSGFTVVTVAAWVLQRTGTGWDGGMAVRYAVPLGGPPSQPAVLATPWVLPSPRHDIPDRTWHLVDDNELERSAAGALRAAGYRRVQRVEIRRDPALPAAVNAAVTAIPPGNSGARDLEVWLSADASAVLGHLPGSDLPVPGALP